MPFNYPYTPYNPGFPPNYGGLQAPQSAQALPVVNNTPIGFVCRPVTSKAEAETAQVPFDGSTTYFVDTSSGKIYAKTFNFNTGAAPIVTYIQEPVTPVVRYATIDDLNVLREELTRHRKAKRDDEPDE